MLYNKEFNQTEELSACLDNFNNGRHSITQDEEIKELIEMANLVKRSYSQDKVPQLLIDELVDTLAAELKAQKQQKLRTHWLYGGFAGTVAAIFIAVFVQFLLPQSVDNNIAQQFDQSIVPTALQATNAMMGQQVQSGSSTEAPAVVSVEKKATDDHSKVIAEIVQVPESPVIDQKPNQVAMLQQENPKDRTNSLREDKKIQLERRIAIMVLPNQTTQSITVDNTSGVIRQVYNQGTNDEIIIIQRLLDESMTKTRDDAKQGEVQAMAESAAIQTINKDTKDTINSLTVIVGEYYITIEGKKTKEDLQKIAESLTGMK